jgi:hypothetical protein
MAPINVAYDEALLFITDRKTEKIIPLKSITHIGLVPGNVAFRKRWEITYAEKGIEECLFFYPKDGTETVASFVKAVRAQNSTVNCSDIY